MLYWKRDAFDKIVFHVIHGRFTYKLRCTANDVNYSFGRSVLSSSTVLFGYWQSNDIQLPEFQWTFIAISNNKAQKNDSIKTVELSFKSHTIFQSQMLLKTLFVDVIASKISWKNRVFLLTIIILSIIEKQFCNNIRTLYHKDPRINIYIYNDNNDDDE